MGVVIACRKGCDLDVVCRLFRSGITIPGVSRTLVSIGNSSLLEHRCSFEG